MMLDGKPSVGSRDEKRSSNPHNFTQESGLFLMTTDVASSVRSQRGRDQQFCGTPDPCRFPPDPCVSRSITVLSWATLWTYLFLAA